MLRKLAGLGVNVDHDTQSMCKELHLLVICQCGLYVFDDANVNRCPRSSCGRPKNNGRHRARKMVLVNVVERLRGLFANRLTAKYLAYAAERDNTTSIYAGDLWDKHKRLKRMDSQVLQSWTGISTYLIVVLVYCA